MNLNYPNMYANYAYNNGNTATQYMPQTQPQYMNPQTFPTMQPQGLNGKIVDSVDVARATEVPIGGYGIFPKADLKEIYVKVWNNDGTTGVISYKPILDNSTTPPNVEEGISKSEILEKFGCLEEKMDKIIKDFCS